MISKNAFVKLNPTLSNFWCKGRTQVRSFTAYLEFFFIFFVSHCIFPLFNV